MPSGATDGSIVWDRIDNVPVAGRVVVIDRKAGLASNFDCCVCTCGASYAQLIMSPTSYTLAPTIAWSLTATARYSDRCGDVFYSNVTPYSVWSTTNSSVATVSGGTVTGAGGGTATITAIYTDDVWTFDSQKNICNATPTPHSCTSSITVQVPAYVGVVTSTPTSALCGTSNHHAGVLQVWYDVLNSSKSPIKVAGMSVSEQLSWTSSVCSTSNACCQQ